MVKRWKQRADGHYGAQTRIAGANAPEPHVSSNRRRKNRCLNFVTNALTSHWEHRGFGGRSRWSCDRGLRRACYVADRSQNRRSAGFSGRYVLGLRGGGRMRQGCRVHDMNRWMEAAVEGVLEPVGGAGRGMYFGIGGGSRDISRPLSFWGKGESAV